MVCFLCLVFRVRSVWVNIGFCFGFSTALLPELTCLVKHIATSEGHDLLYVGLDDTDTLESRGTGRLARDVAAVLSQRFRVFGVTRHQLLVHPDIPFTSHNSCAVIHLETSDAVVDEVFEIVKKVMLGDFIVGSDPGLAVALLGQVSPAIIAFGQDAKDHGAYAGKG